MSDPFLIAIVALGLSGLASAVKLVDWLLTSDPKALARTMRWLVIGIALLSVPLLIFLLVKEQWAAAAGLVAVMLLMLILLGRGSLLRPLGFFFRPVLDNSPPVGPSDQGAAASDPDLVRRSAAVLSAYLGRTGGPDSRPDLALPALIWQGEETDVADESNNGFGSGAMSQGEALEILGLDPGAADWQICEAHRRLLQKLHPERGGSAYLAIKVTQARDVLLRLKTAPSGSSSEAPRRLTSGRPYRREQ